MSLKTFNTAFTIIRLCVFVTGLGLLIVIGGCGSEPETAIHVKMDGAIPPSFSFSGPWWASEFKVLEMPPRERNQFRGHDFAKDKMMWSIIDPDPPPKASQWPRITYGVIPERFRQEVPASGKPEQLLEGKIYSAQAVDNIGNGGLIYFTIRDGRATELKPSEVFYDR
jgi:hypothetical protein